MQKRKAQPVDWTFVGMNFEKRATELQNGEINVNLKVRHGKVANIEEVESFGRRRIMKQPLRKKGDTQLA